MPSIERISSAMSEQWTAWALLVLLICLLIGNLLERNAIKNAYIQLFATKERDIFVENTKSIAGQFVFWIYKAAIIALAVYLAVAPHNSFCFSSWLIVCGLVLAYMLIKLACGLLVAYVFNQAAFKTAFEQYQNLTMVITTIVFPLLLISVYVPFISKLAINITVLALISFFVIMWIIKAITLFLHKPLDILYIFLYLCTLEALPFLGVIALANYLVC